jgi:hypothetical protein
MQESVNLPGGSFFGNETFFLWLAVGLAVIFLGLLAFDVIKRRNRERLLRKSEPKGLRAKSLTPIQRARALKSDLEQMLQERSLRKDQEQRRPPETRP